MAEHEDQIIPKRKRIRTIISSSDEDEPTPSTSTTISTNASEISGLAGIVKDLVRVMEMKINTDRSVEKNTNPSQNNVLPTFDPEDRQQSIIKWCERIDELKRLYNWSEEATAYSAISKLTGLASTWYRSLPTINYTWEEWKVELKKAFPPRRDFYQDLQEMMQRTKRREESYIVYYYEKVALMNECQIFGSEAVSCILGGISDTTVQAAARANDYPTCEALLNFLKTCDISQPSTSGTWTPIPFKHHQRQREKHVKKHAVFKSKTNFTCYKCQNQGHRAAECRTTKCYNCHGYGHRAQDCRKRQQKNNQQGDRTEKVL